MTLSDLRARIEALPDTGYRIALKETGDGVAYVEIWQAGFCIARLKAEDFLAEQEART